MTDKVLTPQIQDVFVSKSDAARHIIRPHPRQYHKKQDTNQKINSLEPKFAIRRKFFSETKRKLQESIITPQKKRLSPIRIDIRKLWFGYSPLKTQGTTIQTRDSHQSKPAKRINTEQVCIVPQQSTLEDQPLQKQQKSNIRTNYLKALSNIKFRSQNHSKRTSPQPLNQEQTFPIANEICQLKYAHILTHIQKDELKNYSEIFYINKKRSRLIGLINNFDDEHGDLKVYAQDHICFRYEIISIIGKGAFGQVFKAYDHKNKQEVALKIVKNKSKYTNQAMVEAKILNEIKTADPTGHYNIIRLKQNMMFRGHMCLTFELMHINLYDFLKQHKFKGFSLQLIHRLAIQILQALILLNQKQIIHCDLKPENIMLKHANKSGLKVIDMGSSCYANQIVFTYIQSRYYRAPEIILGVQYTTAIDMWSFGCILSELYTGAPLFPGENESQLIGLMVELVGTPPTSLLSRSRRKKFFDEQGELKNVQDATGKIYRPATKILGSVVECANQDFIALIKRCIEWQPNKRITPAEALLDKWITDSLPNEVRARHLQQMKKQAPHLFPS